MRPAAFTALNAYTRNATPPIHARNETKRLLQRQIRLMVQVTNVPIYVHIRYIHGQISSRFLIYENENFFILLVEVEA